LLWVPGQRGIKRNEKTCILARKGQGLPLQDQNHSDEHERAKLWEQLSGLAHSKKLPEGYHRKRSFLSAHCCLKEKEKRKKNTKNANSVRLLNTL